MTDLVWMPGDEGCRSRKVPVAGVLWHWTAGSGDAPAVIRTLKERGLSIHYVIDYHGVVTKCADPATTVCYQRALHRHRNQQQGPGRTEARQAAGNGLRARARAYVHGAGLHRCTVRIDRRVG